MDLIGFSTGAVARSDFRAALSMLARAGTNAVELSALRLAELAPLLEAVPTLDLSPFRSISVHAPSAFPPEQEAEIASALRSVVVERDWPVVVHPDAIHRFDAWTGFGRLLCIENMDKRKPIGRNVGELAAIFDRLPDASLCFDIAHARQVDPSMTEAFCILREFGPRIAQVHVSEVGVDSRHTRLTNGAIRACREVSELIPADVPVIIEAPVIPDQIEDELVHALEAFGRSAVLAE